MTGFSSLPNELIVQVWRHLLEPESVENFALTSKAIHALGSSFIKEHNTLKAKFSFILHEDDVGNGPAETLEILINNPRAALYVRSLTTDGWRMDWEDFDHYAHYAGATQRLYPEDTMELFRHAIKDSLINSEIDIAPWLNALETGNEGVVLSTILTMLPNVRSLDFYRLHSPENFISRTIKRIADSQDTKALSQLAEVRLVLGGGVLFDWFWVSRFATLPSLRAIEAWIINTNSTYDRCLEPGGRYSSICCDTDRECHKGCHRRRLSTVTHLTFVNCFLNPDGLEGLLKDLRALESFEYLSSEDGLYRLQEIVYLLHTYAKHSLRKLRLRADDKLFTHAISLVDFQVISELELGDGLVQDSLANILPPSIERFHLRRLCNATPEVVENDVLEVTVNKAERLPNLQELTLELSRIEPRLNAKTISAMKRKCEDAGIKLSIVGDQKTISCEDGQLVVVRK